MQDRIDDFFTRETRMPNTRHHYCNTHKRTEDNFSLIPVKRPVTPDYKQTRFGNDEFFRDFNDGIKLRVNMRNQAPGVHSESISTSTVVENGNRKTVTKKSVKKPDGTCETQVQEEFEDAQGHKSIIRSKPKISSMQFEGTQGLRSIMKSKPIVCSIGEFKDFEAPKAIDNNLIFESKSDMDEEKLADDIRHSKVASIDKIPLFMDQE